MYLKEVWDISKPDSWYNIVPAYAYDTGQDLGRRGDSWDIETHTQAYFFTVILMLIDFIIFCEMLIEHRFSYNDQNELYVWIFHLSVSPLSESKSQVTAAGQSVSVSAVGRWDVAG